MKRNVDLTENSVFSRDTLRIIPSGDSLNGLLLQMIEEAKKEARLPWVKMFKTMFSESDCHSLILTGSKLDIIKKKENQKYSDGTACDRCGLDLKQIPWIKAASGYHSLCITCSECLNEERWSLWMFERESPMFNRRTLGVLAW